MQRAADLRSNDPRGAAPAVKLALVEAFLACDTLGEAAQLGVDWLARHVGTRQVAVALVDLERHGGPKLVGAASYGLDAAEVASLELDLDDRDNPLVAALGASRAVTISAQAEGATLFGAWRCTAYPLPFPSRHDRDPVGLVLVGGVAKDPDSQWLLGALGRRLVDLRSLRVLSATERRLDRERALFHSILKAVPDPVLLTDPEGRIVVGNARAELYFTAEEEESEGRRRAVALNNMLFSATLTRQAMEGGELGRRELPLVEPSDGSDRFFELMSAPISTPEGPGVVSVLRNVTDLQLAAQEIEDNYRTIRGVEAEVRAERDRLDLIIDSAADPIIVTDARGTKTMTNAPADRFFTAGAEACPEEVRRVRSNDARFASHVSNLFFLDAPGRFRGELFLADPKTGARVPVEAISGKMVNEHGEVTAFVTILHDQTEAAEKMRLYEELKHASDLLERKVRDATVELVRRNELLQRQALELEAASSAKSQFLANMSHEFRTPLNAILGYTSLLVQGISGPLPAPVDKQLRRVDSNAKHLLTIINDILDIARIEAGKMPLNKTRFSIAELVSEVLAEVEPLIARSHVSVKSQMRRGLPRLRSDRAKVKQILMNLISNALKFTPAGSVTVSAQWSAKRPRLTLSVKDTGIGIAERDRERVFQDFRQVDNSPTRPYGGTGLGLAICRRLATVLGGDIKVVSELRRGSTFTLSLPCNGGGR